MAVADRPKAVSTLVNQSHHLGHLLRMLHQQQRLLEKVRALLPPPLADHCLHARIQGKKLILHVDSAAWGSRLRFMAPPLLKGLAETAPHLRELVIRTLPPEPTPRPASSRPRPPRPLSEQVTDPELQRLLRRLRAAKGKPSPRGIR